MHYVIRLQVNLLIYILKIYLFIYFTLDPTHLKHQRTTNA